MRQFNEELIEEVREYRENEKCSTEDAFTSVFSSYVIDAGESFLNNCNVLSYRKEYEKSKINAYVCVTYSDENFIKQKLKLNIYPKEVTLFDGAHVDRVFKLACQYDKNVEQLLLISEDDLYFLYNMCKKKKQIKKLLSKQTNLKLLRGIADKLIEQNNLPEWYNAYTYRAKRIIDSLLKNEESDDYSWSDDLMEFWDIHRFFHGVAELERKDAIFTYLIIGHTIRVTMYAQLQEKHHYNGLNILHLDRIFIPCRKN
jgi:hypothetical protein